MATVANEIDTILNANPAPPEPAPADRELLILSSAPGGFKVPTSGPITPASITFDAVPLSMPGAVVAWSATGGTITTAGNHATLTSANATTDSVTVTATLTVDGVLYTRSATVQKVYDGAEGVSYVTAYCASATASTTTAPGNTTGKASFPVANAGGITGTWSKTVPVLTSGQFMYQSDGLYDPATNQVTWSIPYWSTLKVGNLSAITLGVMGAITSGSMDIGTGATSWHVDSLGNQWAGAGSFNSAPFRVTNTGAATMSSVDIIGPSGAVVLSSGTPLSDQTRINRNLAPAIFGWPLNGTTFTNGATRGFALNDPRFVNGEYLQLPASASAVFAISPALGIIYGGVVSVSFDAYTISGTRQLYGDIYGPNVDSSGLGTAGGGVLVTTTRSKFRFTDTIDHADAPKASLRLFCIANGGDVIIGNIKVEYGTVNTAWCDSVITSFNASTYIAAGAFGTLSAYAAYIGNLEIGPTGSIRQGMTDYATGTGLWFGVHGGVPKFSIGTEGGSMMAWNGSSLTLTSPVIVSPTISGIALDSFSVAALNPLSVSLANGATRTLGTRTLSLSGGRTPYKTYSWVVAEGAEQVSISGASTATVTVKAGGFSETKTALIIGTGTDANDRSVSTSFTVTATFS